MAQVCGLGPRVGGRLALFCIHRVNRLYGAPRSDFMDMLRRLINCRIIIIIIIIIIIMRHRILQKRKGKTGHSLII